MGIERFYKLHKGKLTEEEMIEVKDLTYRIGYAIAETIEGQGNVNRNVLEHAMANVIAMVLKLHGDMFGFTGNESENMDILIRQALDGMRNKQISYGVDAET